MEGSSFPSSLSGLLCQEDKTTLNGVDDLMDSQLIYTQPLIPSYDLGYEDDYIKFLVQKERETHLESNFYSGFRSDIPSWLVDSRLEAINWVLNTQTLLGFRNQTAYLSITYFDRSLLLIPVNEDQSWAVRLVSIACLSLAVKMGEVKEFALSDYSTMEGYKFSWQLIQKMELLILSFLQWNLRFTTPFSYLHYFSYKLGGHGLKLDQLIYRAVQLVMSILKEINLNDYRPSMVAAAAVLAATEWQLTREALKCKLSTFSLLEWETSENEQMLSCHSIMQGLLAKGNTNNLATPICSDIDQTSANTSGSLGSKRMLAFTDSDQSQGLEEKKTKQR